MPKRYNCGVENKANIRCKHYYKAIKRRSTQFHDKNLQNEATTINGVDQCS